MKKSYLATPGPSPVPESVRLKMAEAIIHHRTSQYRAYTGKAAENLKKIFKTEADVLILAASGTGAMEAAVANVVAPGDKAITIEGGKFGQRWTQLVESFGGKPVVLELEWGEGPDPAVVEKLLKENDGVKAVYATHCETSTGTVQDIEGLGKVVRQTDALLVVDGISSIGAVDMKTDDWGVDILCVGSQKALMLPPGLAFAAVNEKAWKVIEATDRHVYYFDLLKARKSAAKNDTPYTPAVSMVRALCEATEIIVGEGVDAVLARHERLATATRAAMVALGLTLLSKAPSNSVTAVVMPEGVDADALRKHMTEKYGVSVAGGQEQLKGRIIRIAHMGYMGDFDVITAVSALEMTMAEMGLDVSLGAGVAACQKALLNG
ncbi:MAG: pyridoxal-phosphate-dependent aminotransferase family protein [Planctomycetota bacterium]|jgi:aspartate aminotransferase-like enzyme